MADSRYADPVTALDTLIWRLRAKAVLTSLARLEALVAKANFDPNQPRVPRGHSDRGQRTRVPGLGAGEGSVGVTSDVTADDDENLGIQLAQLRSRWRGLRLHALHRRLPRSAEDSGGAAGGCKAMMCITLWKRRRRGMTTCLRY